MRIPIYQVSAFANGPFTGNPAAVCPLDEWLSVDVMQAIAAENNLSETAFLVRRDDNAYDLRWFTPTVEVDLCGHATLASGHVVLHALEQASRSTQEGGSVTFHTRSGELHVGRKGGLLTLDIPSKRPVAVDDSSLSDALESVLGVRPIEVLQAELPIAVFENEQQVSDLKTKFALMLSQGIKWLSVTAPASDSETDFVSRYFAPGSGIDEDPVTGSAHGWLTPFWSKRLGKRSLVARQVSRRGGWLWCEDRGDRVSVAGQVVNYLVGEITVGQ